MVVALGAEVVGSGMEVVGGVVGGVAVVEPAEQKENFLNILLGLIWNLRGYV